MKILYTTYPLCFWLHSSMGQGISLDLASSHLHTYTQEISDHTLSLSMAVLLPKPLTFFTHHPFLAFRPRRISAELAITMSHDMRAGTRD